LEFKVQGKLLHQLLSGWGFAHCLHLIQTRGQGLRLGFTVSELQSQIHDNLLLLCISFCEVCEQLTAGPKGEMGQRCEAIENSGLAFTSAATTYCANRSRSTG
jgi:hypothetical protein